MLLAEPPLALLLPFLPRDMAIVVRRNFAVKMKERRGGSFGDDALLDVLVACGAGLVMMRRVSLAELMTIGPLVIAPQRALSTSGKL